MADDKSLDLEKIKAEILQFPDKEYYPGFFEEFRRVRENAKRQAAYSNPRGSEGIFGQTMMDVSIKANLVREWRRLQLQKKQANDNSSNEPR